MRKNIYFLYKWFDAELWSRLLAFVVLTVLSFCIQFFLFWIGELLAADKYCGIGLDIFMFGLLILLVITMLNAIIFPPNETSKSVLLCSILILMAVITIYVNIVLTYLWWVLLMCFSVLLICGIILGKIWTYIEDLRFSVGLVLIYCIGTYLAMLIYGIKPAIDTFSISCLSCVTAIMWLYPTSCKG